MSETLRIAKITHTRLGFDEDIHIFTPWLTVDYGGDGQNIGGIILRGAETDRWLRGVLVACGVDSWEEIKGRTIHVIADDDTYNARVIGIQPLPTEPGERFLFEDTL